ncbi:tripartite tricarboxylate transporter TctB family protein [Pararhodobacter sp.]|uniref:tripartite tricarboxylate transporter TctB family protein n=1 Tax=Pararhodobacter sp. TaxID=2127056 RepID=UPI002FDE4FFA
MSEGGQAWSMRLRSKDFAAGLVFAFIGLSFAYMGTSYGLGTARRMGPGYLPVGIGGVLCLVGTAMMVKALVQAAAGTAVPRLYLRPLILLTASVFAFALTINRFGLVVACVLCVVLAGAASTTTRWREIVLVAIGMAAFSWVVFIELLGLPMRIWRW